jgi:GcrA cell cycle regulator
MSICDMENQTPPSPRWSAERTQLALRLWREGISATSIAERLGSGVSRCAVLSKMHRIKGGSGRAAPADLALPKAISATGPAGRKASRRDINRSVVRSWVACADVAEGQVPRPAGWRSPRGEIDPKAFAALAGSRPRPWLQRGRGECAWPVELDGHQGGPWSCCEPVRGVGPYCPAHAAAARDPDQPTAEMLARETDLLTAWLARRGG